MIWKTGAILRLCMLIYFRSDRFRRAGDRPRARDYDRPRGRGGRFEGDLRSRLSRRIGGRRSPLRTRSFSRSRSCSRSPWARSRSRDRFPVKRKSFSRSRSRSPWKRSRSRSWSRPRSLTVSSRLSSSLSRSRSKSPWKSKSRSRSRSPGNENKQDIWWLNMHTVHHFDGAIDLCKMILGDILRLWGRIHYWLPGLDRSAQYKTGLN